MPRDRDEPAAVRVYTVCDESKYLIVRNVPSLGCGDELANLFGTYGPVEECKPMDAEDCEPYTDVFFINFSQVSNARFAKRKLDESVFLGNRLQVSYAPQFESLSDTKEKLEVRRKEVLGRIKSSAGRLEGLSQYSLGQGSSGGNSHHQISSNKREYMKTIHASHIEDPRFSHVPSNKDYFPSESMNATVKLVREKLDKWIFGFVAFFPGAAPNVRRGALPWHILFGLFVYILALASTELWFLEKLTFLQSSGHHPPMDQLQGFKYCIASNPPWGEANTLVFQHYILSLGTAVMIPTMLIPLMGGNDTTQPENPPDQTTSFTIDSKLVQNPDKEKTHKKMRRPRTFLLLSLQKRATRMHKASTSFTPTKKWCNNMSHLFLLP